jgi:hypothetical protein
MPVRLEPPVVDVVILITQLAVVAVHGSGCIGVVGMCSLIEKNHY